MTPIYVEKVIGLAETMTYNGIHPVVKFVNQKYAKGVKVAKKVMLQLEKIISRVKGIEKWAVDIPFY